MVVILPADRMRRCQDKLAEYHAYSLKTCVDNVAEFTGRTLTNRGKSHGSLDEIQQAVQIKRGILNELTVHIE